VTILDLVHLQDIGVAEIGNMKIFEIITQYVTSNNELWEAERRLPYKFPDGMIIFGDHVDDRLMRIAQENKASVMFMLKKITQDPINNMITSLNENDSFAIFNEKNIGISFVKDIRKSKITETNFTVYKITTIGPNLFPYSTQKLFMVPDQGPCRVMTSEDRRMFSKDQNKAFSPAGRFSK